MADNFLGGPSGSVKIGTSSFSFDMWKLSIKTTLVEVTSFTSGGFQVMVAAVTGATLTVSGPYNMTNMPFTSGVGYIWLLYFTASIYLSVFALIETLEPSMEV